MSLILTEIYVKFIWSTNNIALKLYRENHMEYFIFLVLICRVDCIAVL